MEYIHKYSIIIKHNAMAGYTKIESLNNMHNFEIMVLYIQIKINLSKSKLSKWTSFPLTAQSAYDKILSRLRKTRSVIVNKLLI